MGLRAATRHEQARHVDKLVDATGALNRIICTPPPRLQPPHVALPDGVVHDAPLRSARRWAPYRPRHRCGGHWLVLGIDSIGQLLEQPFSQPANIGVGFDYGLPSKTSRVECRTRSRASAK